MLIKLALFFLSVLSQTFANKSLSCYTTQKVDYDTFPKFTLDGRHPEVIEYTEQDESVTGSPICVMFFGHNQTHSATWQGHVSSFALPMDCLLHGAYYTQCFESPNLFTFLELPSGWACCCGIDNCNMYNPFFFQMFESKTLDRSALMQRVRPICKYFFCVTFILFFVVVEAVIETYIFMWLDWIRKKREAQKAPTEKSAIGQTVLDEPSPMPPVSSLQLQQTQSVRSGTQNVSEMSVKPSASLEVDKTQEDDEEPLLPRNSELDPSSTQRDDTEGNVPIPKRPDLKILPSGRMGRTSMNYEESTYSDLQ
ncbi:unnamed protein product [Caenorhabditis sp. 36 PRJEB53466]|nr:unnamed protein product [Caenorhabditis sp. 36 PRJEB53466]